MSTYAQYSSYPFDRYDPRRTRPSDVNVLHPDCIQSAATNTLADILASFRDNQLRRRSLKEWSMEVLHETEILEAKTDELHSRLAAITRHRPTPRTSRTDALHASPPPPRRSHYDYDHRRDRNLKPPM
jgi:hypothetical protein